MAIVKIVVEDDREVYLSKVVANFVYQIQEKLDITKLEAEQVAGLAIQCFLCKGEDVHMEEYLPRLLTAVKNAEHPFKNENK